MKHVLIAYAVGWALCAIMGLVMEAIRLYRAEPPPRWADVMGWLCAVWLMGPLLVIGAPIWLRRWSAWRRSRPDAGLNTSVLAETFSASDRL
jgi:hypothetical protein